MSYAPKKAYLVPHTHWDREWYLPCGRFRLMLAAVIGRVLDDLEDPDSGLDHFLLDGQTVALEDHLALEPGDESRLMDLVADGKLSVGPWYVLPDEFLISAESHVRNLIVGHRVARRFGEPQKVGYMPDSFGHIAQMPQLLRRAGIDSFVYTRGHGSEIDDLGWEHIWRAPDGSEVTAVNQCDGYCNAAALGHAELWHAHTRREIDPALAVEKVRELFAKMAGGARSPVALLNNGCDHHPPQPRMNEVLAALREAFPETEFEAGSLTEYLEAMRASRPELKSFTGEMLGGYHHPILSGVWSARLYLKQQNDICQTLLCDVLEPLAVWAAVKLDAGPAAGLLDDLWRTLLRNHPHDSICGCSTDEVHREMETRFDRVEQSADQACRMLMEKACPSFGSRPEHDRDTVIAVFNTLPARRVEVVERMVVLQPFGLDIDDLELVDQSGAVVPFTVARKDYVERFWGLDWRSELSGERQRELYDVYRERFADRMLRDVSRRDESDIHALIRFRAELPPLGLASFTLRPRRSGEAAVEVAPEVVAEGSSIANGLVSVRLHPDGSFDLRHGAAGCEYRGLNLLVDEGDVGDEYDFSPCPDGVVVSAAGAAGEIRVLDDDGLRARLEAAFTLDLPAAVGDDRRSRVSSKVACPVKVRVGLEAGSEIVSIETIFANNVCDHRLRADFPAGIRTDELVGDGHFLWNRRPVDIPPAETFTGWSQPTPETVPQQDFSLLGDGSRGLAVLNRGLPEIAALRDGDGAAGMALTLLRGVGWLSRDDFASRNRTNAGPTLPTPEAQCPGERRFRYAVLPFAGDPVAADVAGSSRRWRVPPLTKQGVFDGLAAGGEGLLEVRGQGVTATAIKPAESLADRIVVRLCNLTGERTAAELRCGVPLHGAWLVDLLEENEIRRLRLRAGPDSDMVRVSLDPYAVQTVTLWPVKRG